jgi:hypothetical protein
LQPAQHYYGNELALNLLSNFFILLWMAILHGIGVSPSWAIFGTTMYGLGTILGACVLAMSNAFGFVLDDASVRRAVVEGVPETVIAAIYLLHERSVGEVAAKLTPVELEHVIRLVGRCPSCYPLGTLDALKSKRAASLTPTAGSPLPNARREAAAHPHRRPPARPEARQGTPNASSKPTGFQGPPARERVLIDGP